MPDDDQLPSIDPVLLAAVLGGASDQIATMLQSLLSSIKDLAKTRNSGGGSNQFMQQMLPMMMMMRGGQQSAPVAQPTVGPPPGEGWIKAT